MKPFRTVNQQSGSYPIWLGRGILDQLHEVARHLQPAGNVILLLAGGIADSWGERIRDGLGRNVPTVVFSDSEEHKTLATAGEIVDAMLEAGVRRDWLAIVAGGGSAGDVGGFASSIFMRGIRYVHVPTTLLAQVDSSIGGKLAVNRRSGKNLVGTFAAPSGIVADLDTLQTLPQRELRSGLYEALKGGILGDRVLFELMEREREKVLDRGAVLEEVVSRAIDVKVSVVSEDEREGDRRRLLNYGHTIGHGFETATGYSVLTHGDAVAWGMIAANAIAAERKLIAVELQDRLNSCILAYGPDPLPDMPLDEILGAIRHDKKFKQDRQVMVLPVELGSCEVFEDITADEIETGIAGALDQSART